QPTNTHYEPPARTAPPPVATPGGRLPTRVVATTPFVLGASRETEKPVRFATHTAPSSAEISNGSSPTGIVATIEFVAGSIRVTMPRLAVTCECRLAESNVANG